MKYLSNCSIYNYHVILGSQEILFIKFCSPQNPIGKVFTHEELEVIADECRTRNCFAITDEVW